jgi:hypothetical protein
LVACHPFLEGRGQRRLAPEHPRRGNATATHPEGASSAALRDLIEVQRRPLEVYEQVLR